MRHSSRSNHWPSKPRTPAARTDLRRQEHNEPVTPSHQARANGWAEAGAQGQPESRSTRHCAPSVIRVFSMGLFHPHQNCILGSHCPWACHCRCAFWKGRPTSVQYAAIPHSPATFLVPKKVPQGTPNRKYAQAQASPTPTTGTFRNPTNTQPLQTSLGPICIWASWVTSRCTSQARADSAS